MKKGVGIEHAKILTLIGRKGKGKDEAVKRGDGGKE